MAQYGAPPPPPFNGGVGHIPRISPNDEAAKQFLTSHKWPTGFQTLLLKQMTETIPLRFFICDDSGSMFEDDGQHLVSNGTIHKALKCTRYVRNCLGIDLEA